jgi:mannose/cellobiose epimerase-like protein (N-acyl-D-glucosamine 2-epimerase family)
MTLATYLAWMRDDALPVWLDIGFDRDLGLFREKLHLDGAPDRTSKMRSRVQARQIYVYAHAAALELSPPEQSLAIAVCAADRFHDFAWAPDGRPGWVHLLGADGSVTDARRDLYDHAFILQALTWLAKVSGEQRFADWREETLDFIDRHLTSAQGGWFESDQRELPRRQNPHMHLFEASLALFETTGELRHLTRADAIAAIFHRHFFDRPARMMWEYFGPAWERDSSYGSHRIEGGHQMEWCWLLRRYSRCRDIDVDDVCDVLFNTSRDLALDLASGFLIDEVDNLGKVLVSRRRLWPQTEYLKALIEQGVSLGDPNLVTTAHDLADRILASYLSETPRGTWRDQFDLDGRLTADHIPASTLYHLFTAGVEIQRLQQSL